MEVAGVLLTLFAVALIAAARWEWVFCLLDWWAETRPVRSYHLLFAVALVWAVAQTSCALLWERLVCVFCAVIFALMGAVWRVLDREGEELREQDELAGYSYYDECG
ncbi:MAG: hypothetical protein QME87_10150 [Bacillota bacterium]|nr:hypothetical protein [Bacillota bacterium]